MSTKFIFTVGLIFCSFFSNGQTVTVTQTTLPAGRGDVDQRILLINITGVSNGTLNTITITMNGTTSMANVSSIKIYANGGSNRFFDPVRTLFGSATPVAGNISITGSRALASGNNYFWLTYDVAAGANEGNVLDATCVSVRRNTTTTTLSAGASNPSGSSTILLANKVIFKSNDIVTNSGVPVTSQYFRIPAIIKAVNGDLITATDARFGTPNDLPFEANIVIRRSTDNGATWLPQQTIADYGSEGAGDASFILDKTNGNIICLFASHNGLVASTPSDPIRLNITKSTDNGVTWSPPVNITNQIYGAGCTNPITQNWYAVWASAGRHTQLANGRMVVAVGVSPTSSFSLSNTFIYSDDGGTTWVPVTTLTNIGAGDESHIEQLNNGNLIMSSRINVNGARKFRISTNMGATWGAQSSWTQINDSRCNGDFVRFSSTTTGDNMNILLHTIPDNTNTTRQNLTVFASQDEGVTWPVKRTIFPGLSQYSSITRLSDNTIGIYYEMADPGAPFEMYFARFSLNWLGISGFTTLPVNLIAFNAQLINNKPELKWISASEVQFKEYQVERSVDGVQFAKIGVVAAQGATSEVTYMFIDQHAAVGKFYYRLKMLDNDGQFKYSGIRTVIIKEATVLTEILPNPFSEKISVRVNNFETGKKYQASIVDAKGVVVKKINLLNANSEIATDKLTQGSYFIIVANEAGKILSSDLIVK